MKTEPTPDRTGARLHQHYTLWFVGDGATVEFPLTRNYSQLEDMDVYVDGALKRPDDNGTVRDYKVRGITVGYGGELNAIKFAVAPANTKNVCVRLVAT